VRPPFLGFWFWLCGEMKGCEVRDVGEQGEIEAEDDGCALPGSAAAMRARLPATPKMLSNVFESLRVTEDQDP